MFNNLRVVSYMRYSSHNQDDSNSIEAQRFAIKRYCDSVGYKISHEYIDKACTGTNTNRTNYQKMINDAKDKKFDILLVHKLDRLHRNTINTLEDIKELKSLGIRYIAVGDDVDTEQESSLTLALKAVLAEEYSKNLSKETRKGLEINAQMGVHNGGKPPYGFKINRDYHLEKDESTAPAIKKIFELYLADMGYNAILKWLDDNGYKTLNGNSFSKTSLYAILGNSKYCGRFFYGKTAPKDNDGHRNSHKLNENYITIENGCPAIITPEQFEAVQEKMKNKSEAKKHYNSKHYYPLNSYIYCNCGSSMSGNISYSGQNKTKYITYRCSKSKSHRSVNASYLNDFVFFIISELLFNPANNERILSLLNKYSRENNAVLNHKYKQLCQSKAARTQKMNNLINSIENGKSSPSILNKINEHETELSAIEKQMEEFNSKEHIFIEEDLIKLKGKFVSYMCTERTVNTKKLIDNCISSIIVEDEIIHINLHPSIATNKSIKNIKKTPNLS